MGLFKNRIRTIAGAESGFWQSTGNLLYYFANPLLYTKQIAKLWLRFSRKTPDYARWIQSQEVVPTAEISGIHFTIVHTDVEAPRQQYAHITYIRSNQPIVLPPDTYVIWLDSGDTLHEQACWLLAQIIQSRCADLVTFDFDLGKDGRRIAPHFQPSWSPVTLAFTNYIQNAVCVKAKHIRAGMDPFSGAAAFYTMLKQVDIAATQTARLQRVLLTKTSCAAFAEKVTVPLQRPKVSIIIPTFNKAVLVKQCVDAILKQSTYASYEIVLVDNNSTEPALSALIETYQQQLGTAFVHVRAEYPFNFSQLMNDGVQASTGTYVLLLNNDTEIITPDWIEQLLAIAVRGDVGAVGAKLLYPDHTIQHAGIELDPEWTSRHVHLGSQRHALVYQDAVNTIRQYSAVTAACLMVSKEKYDEVGGFDTRYKVEFNDVDFCLKLLHRGYYNVYCPHAELYHYESASRQHPMASKKSKDVYLHERALFHAQWGRYISADPYGHPNINLFRL